MQSGRHPLVAVTGRIDAEEHSRTPHRPLVFRRTRFETLARRVEDDIQDSRESVPFEIYDGLDPIAVDADGDGRRASSCSARVRGHRRRRAGSDPRGHPAPGRRGCDCGSSSGAADHAIACGVPSPDGDRGTVLRAGLGRPLIVTTLEPAEAMRLLAVGHRDTTRLVAALFGIGLVALVVGAGWWAVDAVL